MLSLPFLCDLLGINHVVPAINTNSQFQSKIITELAGSRSVSQECLLNAGHVAQEGEVPYSCAILHMHG